MKKIVLIIIIATLSGCANLGPSQFADRQVCTKRMGDKTCFLSVR